VIHVDFYISAHLRSFRDPIDKKILGKCARILNAIEFHIIYKIFKLLK